MKEPEPALQPDSVAETTSEPATVRQEATVQPQRPTVQRLAVKTNLLYDAILMPSLEVEYRIADRWTVNLEGEIAWWKNDGRHKYYQVATISPEGRWWFGQKQGNPWHGHYLGVFGASRGTTSKTARRAIRARPKWWVSATATCSPSDGGSP